MLVSILEAVKQIVIQTVSHSVSQSLDVISRIIIFFVLFEAARVNE